MNPRSEQTMLDQLDQWASVQEPVRLVLLTSTRANTKSNSNISTDAQPDILSDYDIVLVVTDTTPYATARTWLDTFGEVMVYLDGDWTTTDQDNQAHHHHIRMVYYTDGTKIDFQIWPLAYFQSLKQAPALPDNLDVGYRVLLDKDGLSIGLAEPTFTAHIPTKPTEDEYLDLVHEFWWETTYVAKNLYRDELFFARYNTDVVIRSDVLRRMLEWFVEIDHEWVWQPGVMGKGQKKQLPTGLWTELEETFVGAKIEENWDALFKTTTLFRKVATHVANVLGYTYPVCLDEQVTAYLRSVQTTA